MVRASVSMSAGMVPTISTLILLRHGQSIWNGAETRFTGWTDVPLTVKGRVEAVGAGQLLRSRGFRAEKVDVAFTSELQRAHETCELALASMAGHKQETWSSARIRSDARLNERHYGAVQGFLKDDPELLESVGEETIRAWRRSMDEKPPPVTQERPAEWPASWQWPPEALKSLPHEWQPPPTPTTESLRDCQKRVLECFHDRIAPALFDEADPKRSDHTVVVVAHANTIRSLMAAFDGVPDALVPSLHVPNSVPILYRFERHSRELLSTRLQSAAGGSHARWLLSAENHANIQDALQPGGMLTRALFDSWRTSSRARRRAGLDDARAGNRVVSIAEMEAGLRAMLADDVEQPVNSAVLAIAKKVVRELGGTSPDATVTLDEFEALVASEVADIEESVRRQNARDTLGGGRDADGSESETRKDDVQVQ